MSSLLPPTVELRVLRTRAFNTSRQQTKKAAAESAEYLRILWHSIRLLAADMQSTSDEDLCAHIHRQTNLCKQLRGVVRVLGHTVI